MFELKKNIVENVDRKYYNVHAMHDIFFGKNKILKINFQYFKIYFVINGTLINQSINCIKVCIDVKKLSTYLTAFYFCDKCIWNILSLLWVMIRVMCLSACLHTDFCLVRILWDSTIKVQLSVLVYR